MLSEACCSNSVDSKAGEKLKSKASVNYIVRPYLEKQNQEKLQDEVKKKIIVKHCTDFVYQSLMDYWRMITEG